MKNFFFPRLIWSFVIAGVMVCASSTFVAAENTENSPRYNVTTINLVEINPIALGEPIEATGEIKDQYNIPVANKIIEIRVDGEYEGRALTDENGLFLRIISNDLIAGIHTLTASSNRTKELSAASVSVEIVVLPALVEIQTVPSIPGIAFQIDGQKFVSGADGLASIEINEIGQYRLDVLIEDYYKPLQRIEFGRWPEEVYEPFLDIQVPTKNVIQVGLNVYHLVSQSFVDLDGREVDPDRITEFEIRSAQGDVFVFNDGNAHWIPSSRVARRVSGLEETQLLYSVIYVMVDGSNVVNQSQQRFYAQPGENWEISLLFNSLQVSAKDFLFQTKVGKSVDIEFPDGSVKNYPLDQNGMAEIFSLSRGNYYIQFVGTNGLNIRTPVALSKNQEVNLKVITYLDVGIVVLLGLTVMVGLLFYGRPWLFHGIIGKINRSPKVQESVKANYTTLRNDQGGVIAERLLRFEEAKSLGEDDFIKLTGVSVESFEKILTFIQQFAGKSNRKPILSQADQLMLALILSKKDLPKGQLATAFNVSASTVVRTTKTVFDILANSEEFNLLLKENFQREKRNID